MPDLTFTKQEIQHLYLLHANMYTAFKHVPDQVKRILENLTLDLDMQFKLLTIEQMDELGKKMSVLLNEWK